MSARLPPYLRSLAAEPAEVSTPTTEPPAGPRPFVLTAGRVTATDLDINVETQVSANGAERDGARGSTNLATELRAILTLCARPTSIAEISAQLRLHLGVTKILVSDLRAAGHVEIHTVDLPDAHSPETIMRVMSALRAIT